MADKRRQRPWIKVQLSRSDEAQEVAALVKAWKAQRQATANIIQALRLYAALCRGDTSVLETYFPGLVLNTHVSPTARRVPMAPLTVTFAPRSGGDDLSDALDGLGLDSLDFAQDGKE